MADTVITLRAKYRGLNIMSYTALLNLLGASIRFARSGRPLRSSMRVAQEVAVEESQHRAVEMQSRRSVANEMRLARVGH